MSDATGSKSLFSVLCRRLQALAEGTDRVNIEQELNETRGEVKALRQLLDAERVKVAAHDDWLARHHEEWKRAEEAEARLKAICNVPSPTDLLTNAVARAMFEYASREIQPT